MYKLRIIHKLAPPFRGDEFLSLQLQRVARFAEPKKVGNKNHNAKSKAAMARTFIKICES